jgi:hypothetical protein
MYTYFCKSTSPTVHREFVVRREVVLTSRAVGLELLEQGHRLGARRSPGGDVAAQRRELTWRGVTGRACSFVQQASVQTGSAEMAEKGAAPALALARRDGSTGISLDKVGHCERC